LFNSHLFDFTPGWMYVFGVGILGAMAMKTAAQPASGRPPSNVASWRT
jgi:O-antigen ligase